MGTRNLHRTMKTRKEFGPVGRYFILQMRESCVGVIRRVEFDFFCVLLWFSLLSDKQYFFVLDRRNRLHCLGDLFCKVTACKAKGGINILCAKVNQFAWRAFHAAIVSQSKHWAMLWRVRSTVGKSALKSGFALFHLFQNEGLKCVFVHACRQGRARSATSGLSLNAT